MKYVVDFDPGLAGPFDTREEASGWADRTVRVHGAAGITYSWHVAPMCPPDEIPKAVSGHGGT